MVITHDEFRSPNDLRNLRIWLPDNYWQTEERFPVTYFLDGQWALGDPTTPTDTPANNAAEKDARHAAASGARRRKAPKPLAAQTRRGLCLEDYLRTWHKPMIVVGIPSPETENERAAELCPWPARIRHTDIARAGGAEFADWLADVVKPHVDARLHTWSHREATAICGFSLGGMAAAYATAARNDAFSKARCLSPSARTWERQLRREVADAARDRRLSPDTRVFLSFGSRECGRKPQGGDPARTSQEAHAASRLAHALDTHGAATCVLCQRGGRHRMSDWSRLTDAMMGFLWEARLP